MLPTAALNAAEILLARAASAPVHNPIAPAPADATEHCQETSMSKNTATINLLDGLSHAQIADVIRSLAPGHPTWDAAYAQFSHENGHLHTLRAKNQIIVTDALAYADTLIALPESLRADVVAPAPEPEVAPEPAPEVSPEAKAVARAFEKRVKALAVDGDRVRMGIRAKKLALREGFTAEDVEALSDKDCLELTASPIA